MYTCSLYSVRKTRIWIDLEVNMQVLKEKVRAKIVKAAEKEFKRIGFEKASMRAIAANANMTVGNLYRYYKNKEEIFGVVINRLTVKLEKLMDNIPENPKSRLSYLLSGFKELQHNYLAEWLILFGGNGGTRYKKIADEIHQIFEDSVVDILKRGGRRTELAGPITSSIIFGLNSILQSQKISKETCELTNEFLNYMIVDFSHSVA